MVLVDTDKLDPEKYSQQIFAERRIYHSKANYGEAKICSLHIMQLIKKGIPISKIGCITPYVPQTNYIRSFLRKIFF